ncbi:MAG: dynamin family protein [Planctomycetota bacterium]
MSDPRAPLAARLRTLHGSLSTRRDAEWPGVSALVDRLERDLLPRTAGAHDHLVVGVVGPNNAGKSALFNALVEGVERPGAPAPRTISPSIATGGATRRLVGALAPALRRALEGEPTLQRFPMRGVTPGPEGALAATDAPEDGLVQELLLVETDTLPDSLLLVDTPDFDSVLRGNRLVTDALLAVSDVALVVVTRHTYQNNDVIEFLARWLDHGRPWVLVYNESIDADTTRAHAAKIESDLGGAPEAVFHAPFDVAVAGGDVALVPQRVDAEGDAELPLARWLRDLGARTDLKARAMEASLAGLRDDLESLGAQARSVDAEVERVTAASRARALPLGRAVAREAMPMGPFLEAFREVLDERPTAVQRELRKGLKWTGAQLFGGARWVASKLSGGQAADADDSASRTLLDAERTELDRRWTGFYEPALVEIRREARDGALPDRATEVLGGVIGADASARAALARASNALALDPALLDEHRAACRDIISRELDERGSEWFLQLAVDAMHLLPLGVAGAVIVQTGGVGADFAVAGGGAAAAALAERLSRTLGTGVAIAARNRWTELRSERIADAALTGLLGDAERDLERLRAEARAIDAECSSWARETAWRAERDPEPVER